ncbi:MULTISPECIES: VIT1/CCC1 transporter family protein [Arthrobacter]|uniref:VIT1/CCC1 family predicted Fe2+/Mn2+ transporter n=1 Tax=Arthrobacter bambusae TaxID=1338426 RepID=A0AAW8DJN7_9MICC|nr:VIT1/CCC1 transporter family protein [Arthrobacter bambusae]MDP9905905.1 VIT1/CCC1 family predicted Fe2+/Mn2+ transporter [Arthrobacter bambusae]MDQ0130136.1 VIT1/CCC1 family predicted Fe2+/Mn2+ transporter [Arthrobacter bambusae]MDQ0181516.1 VIT1/CCC1 family predicted Fe2+/Mn2+ transporter [Arthrobacter bambusae]MDQ0240750.1 VIT1/CCC1 family predicted Fe2+/Mn2+ transporter [Arthrobacter bambusae]
MHPHADPQNPTDPDNAHPDNPSDQSSPSQDEAAPKTPPSSSDIKRWRQYLADERAEAAVYRQLAQRRDGEEREILLALAEAEGRHEAHWLKLLGEHAGMPKAASIRSQMLGFLARNFGSVFVLALAQRAEGRSPYAKDPAATRAMAADEQIHEEVVRGLATRGRNRLSGTFRAAVFGANDGLVSNLSLVMGMAATGVPATVVLFSGIAGLLAGALSMGAGEYVSVRSQLELLKATRPTQATLTAAPALDIEHNELVLVYLARGMSREAAEHRAAERMGVYSCDCDPSLSLHPEVEETVNEHEAVGSAWGAAISSFCFFASGAIVPILPFIFGMTGFAALAVAGTLVGIALLSTGAVVGLLSGTSPLTRGLRQLAIGLGAAAATYGLGFVFGAVIG